MIRVLHSVSNMDRAGIESFIMNYYRHMDRDQVQFDFLANKRVPGAFEPEIERLGGHVYRSPGFSPLKFPRYVRFLKQTLKSDPDIRLLHVHNGALGLYALVAGKLLGVRHRLYHAHSTKIPTGKGHFFKSLIKPFIKYAATDLLACGDESARFYYGDRNVDAGKCVFVHNAVVPAKFAYHPETRDRMREKAGLGEGVVVGHVGRFTETKNHVRILRIFDEVKKRLPDAKLLLVGTGENEQAIKETAAALPYAGDIVFTGDVSNVNEWYQAMDVFLMPSKWEGLPVVGIEAQAAGLPCFFSAVVTRETAVTDLAAFISLDEPDEAWADAIVNAVTAGAPRRDTSAEIRKAGYDVAREAAELQALYLRLAADGGKRA